MQTHAERFRHMMQEWGLTQEALGDLCGIKRGTVGTIVNGKTVPDVEALARLKQSKPRLSWDWLLLGKGEMLLPEGESTYLANLQRASALVDKMAKGDEAAPTETQKPEPQQPTPGLVSGPATVAEAENILLRERIADKDVIIEMLRAELGKSNDSPDAAGSFPTTPRKPISGFMTDAQRAEIAEAFNEVVEEEMSEGSAVVVRR